MKEIMDKLDLIKIKKKKDFCEEQCQENEKASRKLGENICKRYIKKKF